MLELLDRADLDRADPGRGKPRGHLAGLVHVLGLDEEEPAELFFRLREGAVGNGRLPAANPDGPGAPRAL